MSNYEKFATDMKVDIYNDVVDNEYGDRLIDYMNILLDKLADFNALEGGVPNDDERYHRVEKVRDRIADMIIDELKGEFYNDDHEPANRQYPDM